MAVLGLSCNTWNLHCGMGALVHSDQSGKNITASLATVGREHSSTMESWLKI